MGKPAQCGGLRPKSVRFFYDDATIKSAATRGDARNRDSQRLIPCGPLHVDTNGDLFYHEQVTTGIQRCRLCRAGAF